MKHPTSRDERRAARTRFWNRTFRFVAQMYEPLRSFGEQDVVLTTNRMHKNRKKCSCPMCQPHPPRHYATQALVAREELNEAIL